MLSTYTPPTGNSFKLCENRLSVHKTKKIHNKRNKVPSYK